MNHGIGPVIAVVAGVAAAAAAQSEPSRVLPKPEPVPVKPTPGTAPGKSESKKDVIPGLVDDDQRLTAAALRAEGTFLVEKRASMITLGTGERVVVFHKDDEGKRERPMVLVRCQRLAQMVQMAEGRGENPIFIVTGQVSVYRGVNYLQPTAARAVSSEILEAPATATVEASPGPGDPAVQDLIRQLESQRESQRGTAAAPDTAPAAEENETPAVPEGQGVVRRRGRLVRLNGGEWALAFDTGAAAGAKAERPMMLSPCLNLQRMEMWAMQRGDATSFEISGRTLAYGGRTYLIPTMFQVYPSNELEARQ